MRRIISEILSLKIARFFTVGLSLICLLFNLSPQVHAASQGSAVFHVKQSFELVNSSVPPDEAVIYCLTPEDEGNPMPVGSNSDGYIFTLSGDCDLQIGPINFSEMGIYTYKLTCLNNDTDDCTYDRQNYTLEMYVTNDLSVNSIIYSDDGMKTDEIFFKHVYKGAPIQQNVVISGNKTWNYGSAPINDRPDSIEVIIKNGGSIVKQFTVSESDGWMWSISLPKCDKNGVAITYTIDEGNVPHYTHTVDGFNLINTYKGQSYPGDTPKTGDNSNIMLWVAIVFTSGILLIFVIRKSKKIKVN
ncbi:MAG: Cna B-type domain-containing protein [Clostridiales bacterium]|jgi:pilin isopeptide linkage protein/LPXTG-motif cell wall-anchored protein|nr:Cna B-type domain-containing protein [Clostridiales bacterium]